MAPHPSWHALGVAARVRFLASLAAAPLAEVDEGSGVTTVITGVFDNTLNGAFHARLDASDADAVIAATLARFRRRHAPAIWWLDPDSTPADLPRRLVAAGCEPERTGIVRGGVVADLLGRAGGPKGRTAVEVQPVHSGDDLDRWIEVARAAWSTDAGEPSADLDRRRALYAGLGLGPDAALRHWVALAGARTVGMCSAFHADQDRVLLVDHLEVVEDARRQGVGGTLMGAMLGEARRRGCRWAVLEPTPTSAPFYDALGLEVEACRPDVEFYLPVGPRSG